ncbi:FMN-binding negative transcriptional regulator [Mesorhizobium sp. WSM3626]|uniref:FMN-binding negative transcriptional regulator n=1 Tax=Mesorhizobium sp. WSM3626 TaxID=1040987 RepID=UPI002477FF3D|nr:FMN-binding negative transcriptional regulator [Mesorhizobium sp. WSM3626]
MLHSHVARANPIWQDLATGDEVLVIFRQAHAYISPNWYPSKHDFHKHGSDLELPRRARLWACHHP